MASVNLSPIDLTVLSTTRSVDARTVITAGDSDAYQLTVTFSDVESISGTCQMRFVLADGTYYDRDDSDGVTVTGNAVSYMLESAFYTAPGLVCWVQFIDSNLHTQLRIGFPKIRVTGATTEASTAESYPTWAADMRELDFAIGTVETLEPGSDATASITGDIPDKVLNLGIPQGDKGDAATVAVGTVTTLDAGESATVANGGTSAAAVLDFGIPKGDKGDAGEMTIGTVTTLAPGESATVTNSGTSTDAVLDIGIPAGYDGSAVPIDDASSAADRVLSAQYIKGQLSAIGYLGITNLIINGDFSNGTTSWTGSGASLSVASNTLTATTTSGTGIRAYRTVSLALTDQKIYIKCRARVTNANCLAISLGLFDSGTKTAKTVSTPTENTWYDMSGVVTPVATITRLPQFMMEYATAAIALGKIMELQYFTAINLTGLFGSGSEPAKEEIDYLMETWTNEYLDGTQQVDWNTWLMIKIKYLQDQISAL